MIDPRDIALDIKLTFTLPCGGGASPELVQAFAEAVRKECHKRDGAGASLDGQVLLLPGGDETLINPDDDAGKVGVSLSVGNVDDAEELIEGMTTLTAEWWDKYPIHPLPRT